MAKKGRGGESFEKGTVLFNGFSINPDTRLGRVDQTKIILTWLLCAKQMQLQKDIARHIAQCYLKDNLPAIHPKLAWIDKICLVTFYSPHINSSSSFVDFGLWFILSITAILSSVMFGGLYLIFPFHTCIVLSFMAAWFITAALSVYYMHILTFYFKFRGLCHHGLSNYHTKEIYVSKKL